MRTETKQFQIFEFNELTETAQQKAIDNLRDINTDHDWHECTIDDWKDKLNAIGFENAKISFSGFCSQGDGACFEFEGNGKGNVKKLIDHLTAAGETKFRRLRKISDWICVDISRNSFGNHYSHSRTRYASVGLDGTSRHHHPRIEKLVNELEESIEKLREDLSDDIYSDLEKEHDYLQSDEAIKETIAANGYEFTATGKIYS